MKKTLIALAAFGAMAGVAHAQSTVTIYGLVDANLQSYKTNLLNGTAGTPAGFNPITGAPVAATPDTRTLQSGRNTRIESGGLNGSRWGIRISEDLGAGMAAVANLESGFAIDTGTSQQGNRLFGRRANVGVASSSFGTLTIGRNSSPYDDVSADHTMMAASTFDPSNNNNGPTGAQVLAPTSLANAAFFLGNRVTNNNVTWVGFSTRFDNSVKYVTPNFSGFSGSLMYAVGEDRVQTPRVEASRSVSANLKYANGPLLVSGGYQLEGVARTVVTGPGRPALENALLSVAYDLGVAKVGAGFNRARFKDVAGVDNQKEVSLSVAVPFGATTLSASIARSKGDTLGTSTGVGVQALYALSKRSTLYAGAANTRNFDNLVSLLPAGSNVERAVTYGLGVRHTF